MSFRKAYIKLTLLYVLIVMVISVSFSIALYSTSSREINFGLRRQGSFRQAPMGNMRNFSNIESLRQQYLRESNQRLKNNLLFFNLLVFMTSGAVSYFLAKKTLHPVEEMVDMQNRFTADASHELRTPLTAMKTEVEVALRKKNSSQEYEQVLRSNLEEIEKLENLSTGLLELARYEIPINNNAFSSCSIKKIIQDSIKNIGPILHKKNISINLDLQEVNVLGDYERLKELFVILLDNAAKYSYINSPISISAESVRDKVIIKIKDSGPGIKASDLPLIFNRFFRAENSRSKNNVEGYGLGLSIAKRIVQIHKGQIRVESIFGEGSEFTVILNMHRN